MACIRSVMSLQGSIPTSHPKAGPFHPMPSACTICTAIYGNGARIIGWTTIVHLRGTTVPIKTKTVSTGSPAADRGTSLRRSVGARRASRSCKRTQTKSWDFGWLARLRSGWIKVKLILLLNGMAVQPLGKFGPAYWEKVANGEAQ